MSFTNLYYKRTAGTARPCYVCYKPTTAVLATHNTADFLYTCPVHLDDRGFATRLMETGGDAQGTQKPGPSPEEIEKVKEEWEEKQKKKAEKLKDKEKSDDKNKVEEEKEKSKEDKDKLEKSESGKTEQNSPQVSKPASPSHERYSLHRNYFEMRLAEHRKRLQAAQARELGPRLPRTPSSLPM